MKYIALTMMIVSIFPILFAGPKLVAAEGATVEVLANSDKAWNGTSLPDFAPPAETVVKILRITVPPHSALPMHKHPVINAGYLVSGQLTVHTPEGQTRTLNAGDGLIELVNQWHYGRNDSDEPAVIVVVYVIPNGEDITLKQTAPSEP